MTISSYRYSRVQILNEARVFQNDDIAKMPQPDHIPQLTTVLSLVQFTSSSANYREKKT